MEYRFYGSFLTEQDVLCYDYIYAKLLTFTPAFYVRASTEQIHRVMKAILLDHPELFFFEGKWRGELCREGVRVMPKYKLRDDHEQLVAYIEERVSQILKLCTGSLIHKIKVVYDWFLDHVKYTRWEKDQTIEGSLIYRKAVCKGIAKGFQLLMNRLQIPSYLVEGTLDGKSSHIWNVVLAEGKAYHVDVTMGYEEFRHLFRGMSRNRHYPCFLVSDTRIRMTHKLYGEGYCSCHEDLDFDRFMVAELGIPERMQTYGEVKYLDRGATATVFSAGVPEPKYVIKVICCRGNKAVKAGALAELEKLRLLTDTDGIVPLIEWGFSEEKDNAYLLLPYCKSLPVVRREPNFDPLIHTLIMGYHILDTMIRCRDLGIYHLDIQPKNIYFRRDGRAILGDFGCARFTHELDQLPPSVGTVAFMAPEVYHNGVYSQASEIYALGIVMYSLMNHARLPFSELGNTQKGITHRLSGGAIPPPRNMDPVLWKSIEKMCSYQCSNRFSTYEEAQNAISHVLRKLGVKQE